MRHLLWLGPLAILMAIAVYWTSIRPELAGPTTTSTTSRETTPPTIPSTTPAAPDVVEPILVLREIEMAPAPPTESTPELNVPIGPRQIEMPQRAAAAFPRPDVGRESRPWMPYALEDGDLSAQRKLQWARLLVDEAKNMPWVGGAEETSEPPLFTK